MVEPIDSVCDLAKVACSAIRLEILAELAQQPQFVSVLADRLDLDRRHVSVHLKVLAGAGLVCAEESGRTRRYALTPMVSVIDEGSLRTWVLNGKSETALTIATRRTSAIRAIGVASV